jgi:hypothetical protein
MYAATTSYCAGRAYHHYLTPIERPSGCMYLFVIFSEETMLGIFSTKKTPGDQAMRSATKEERGYSGSGADGLEWNLVHASL